MDLKPQWLVTADGRRATLYLCRQSARGDLRVETLESVSNTHEGEHEHERPMLLGGLERTGSRARSGGHAAPHVGSPKHGDDEERRRFCRDLTDWLAGARARLGPAAITVLAPPQMLGLLREHSRALGDPVTFHEGEFAHMAESDLAVHPTIRGVVIRMP